MPTNTTADRIPPLDEPYRGQCRTKAAALVAFWQSTSPTRAAGTVPASEQD